MSEAIQLLNPPRLDLRTRIFQKIAHFFRGSFFIILKFCPILLTWLFKNPLRPIWYVKKRTVPPLELYDAEWGDHKFVRVNGIDLHYVEKGDKNKPLAILLHGFPEFWYSWRYQLKELSTKYWIIAPDLRGYGLSSKPKKVEDYFIKNIVEDVKAFFETLGRDHFTIVGHDWGGIIAWYFASVFPELLDGYVLINSTSAEIWKKKMSSNALQMLKSIYVSFFQFPYLPEFYLRCIDLNIFEFFKNHASRKDIEVYKYFYAEKDAFKYPLHWYRANIPRMPSVPIDPKMKEKPGLIIWGKNDKYWSTEIPYEMQKIIGQKLEIIIICKGGHFVHQEKPNDVNEILNKFMRSFV